ncbi:two-component sensor histidine kinase [Cupriavidus sp. USMAA2-4]|uniref:histidine kinase n=1 Tax=Cupriavidus malaysiensis TaxID=367825 RepID=A0ABM6F7H0_9BURK|nr:MULTISPECIES: HAMP domain-containing sensor histidine kinase [Cupriavidus]AOY92777.1 two-component sensor histidine kinase [Cupriavidus sp. USMAA2-4]AOZ00753.1 two-component sensor histidine kinase [Cupriavidus sp. USMAHM13]AOZ07510.1 two-component sensor histidine kinase [Cupriavidus malaysiensis]
MLRRVVHRYTNYEAELREFRLASSKAGALTAVVLVMAGVLLDYGIYPQEQLRFFLARSFIALLIGGIYALLPTPFGRRHVQPLTLAWLILPQMMIAWMIGVTEGASSIYYAGLNLVIFAVGIALPMGLWQTIGFGAVTYLFYVIACLAHPLGLADRGHFIVNSIFIAFSITASAVYTFMNERGHFHLFRLKEQLAEKNLELAEINRNLAEIKGQMLQQEKMAAIGTLAAGLLHEVNNPVNFCLMAIEVAMEEPVAKANASLEECLVDAKQGMQRIQHIVSDLKTFAYRKPGAEAEGVPFLFEKALDSSCRLTAHELRGVALTRELPADTLVLGDEAAIIGVLINLFSNAALAMRKAQTTKPAIHTSAYWEDGRLHVSVRDNGPGIAPENLARVFEPFFTTREVGQGLGLGLSISYAVIERHRGTLYAESELGQWTAFTFDLPRAE